MKGKVYAIRLFSLEALEHPRSCLYLSQYSLCKIVPRTPSFYNKEKHNFILNKLGLILVAHGLLDDVIMSACTYKFLTTELAFKKLKIEITLET